MLHTKGVHTEYASGESVKGPFGDTITNTEAGKWSFGGAELVNVTISTEGQFSNSSKTIFVDSSFSNTGRFCSSIQNGLDAADALGENIKVIVFPGTYSENLDFTGYSNMEVIGVGKVILNIGSGSGSAITFSSCSNIGLKNLTILDEAGHLDDKISCSLISVNNSGNIVLSNLSIKMEASTLVFFDMIKLEALTGLVTLNNITGDITFLGLDTPGGDETVTMVNYDGSATESNVLIENSKFKLTYRRNNGDYYAFIYPVNFLSNLEPFFSFIIKNSEFEFLNTSDDPDDLAINFELIRCKQIDDDDNYGIVGFFNSLTNKAFNEDIINQNVFFNTAFKILI